MNNISGIIAVNKPQNWTSHDCVAVVRRISGVKRVGHTGTLDPMAKGVLPVCIGTAARITEYLDLDFKSYECTMKLGVITDTLDIWGEILEENKVPDISEEHIRRVVESFNGRICQIPPKYSALKVNGRKLYEYARAGQEVEIKSRSVYINKISVNSINRVKGEIRFTVECSKGTYIRSLCRDIGDKIGCGGTMTSLIRTKTGVFEIKNAVDIEKIKNMTREQLFKIMLPADYPLVHFGKIELKHQYAVDFVNGKKIKKENVSVREDSSHEDMYNIYYEQRFLGVGVFDGKLLKAHKVFDVRMQNDNL